jgi:saccharopine dehydrogenase (NAD+, L-lysine-forming)
MVNAVLLSGSMPPFLTRDILNDPNRQLSVMCDVSCDPTSPNNPLPIYDRITSLDEPSLRLLEPSADTRMPLDLIAIDHLPTLLPRESSLAFSPKLLPHLLMLPENAAVWTRALDQFKQKLEELRDDANDGS